MAVTQTGSRDERVQNYTQRAQDELHVHMQVHDFGIRSQSTINPCFWLCMAAAPSRSDWRPPSRCHAAISGLDAARAGALPVEMDDVPRSEIALFADQLRSHMCNGPTAALHRPDIRDRIFQAFAVLAGEGRARTVNSYEQWVTKLGKDEFTDELVVLATSLELGQRNEMEP